MSMLINPHVFAPAGGGTPPSGGTERQFIVVGAYPVPIYINSTADGLGYIAPVVFVNED